MSNKISSSTDYRHGFYVFACACAVFSISLLNGFALDDLIHIVQNPKIQNSAVWARLFLEPSYPGNLFRPLTNFTYALTYEYFALWPLPYHLTNILLHAAVSSLLYVLLKRIGFDSIAFVVALLFAVHPLHVEAVANVSGRAELLAAFFGVLSLLFFQDGCTPSASTARRSIVFCISAGCLLLAALSKESALVFIGLAFLIVSLQQREFKKSLPGLFTLTGAALIFLLWRYLALGSIAAATGETELLDNPLLGIGAFQRILVALALLGKYAVLCVLPVPLSADYSFAVIDTQNFWASLQAWLNLLVALLLLCVVALTFRRKPTRAFLVAWFFVAFAITANILFPIGTIFGERLAYVPSLGIIGALVLTLKESLSRRVSVFVLCALGGLYACQTFFYSAVWHDNATLYGYQVTVSETSAKTLANYATVLRNKGKLDEASLYYRRALQIYPRFANAAFGIGSVYGKKGAYSGAEHWYHEAISIDPSHAASREALGRLYVNAGKFDDAREQFNAILTRDPQSLPARIGLFALALQEGKLEEAKRLRAQLTGEALGDPDFQNLDARLTASLKQ
ncbi:MAG: tetratricopeptide repeat protein [Deltaproteobacteria bacterium]|nr:tetratricopeptide repeat protein [Deltaproteobacteria bacterium]